MNKMRTKDYFAKAITWNKTPDAEFPYEAVLNGKPISIRLNDFPAENLYTLIADGSEISFDDWPSLWVKEREKSPKKPLGFKTASRGRLVKA